MTSKETRVELAEEVAKILGVLSSDHAQKHLRSMMIDLRKVHDEMSNEEVELVPLMKHDLQLIIMTIFACGVICSNQFEGAIVSTNKSEGVADAAEEEDE